MKLLRYKIYCETEEAWKYWYLSEDDPAPTICPSDTSHNVNVASVSITDIVKGDVQEYKPVLYDIPLKMRGFGFKFEAAAGQETLHDHVLVEDLRFKGAAMFAPDGEFGDTVTVQIVDKDNVLGYGAGVVVAKYVTDWNRSPDGCMDLEADFVGDIAVAGLYVRVIYNSVGGSIVHVAMNFESYKDAA